MRFGSFDITAEGDNYYLVRDDYPRMSLRIVFNNGIAEIRDIDTCDYCTASEMMQILEEIEEFLRTL